MAGKTEGRRLIKAFLAVLWSAALFAAPARAADPAAVAPLRIDYGGWYAVSAKVNGRGPYDFIIDTGATQSLVFESLHAAEAFPPSGGAAQRVLGIASAGAFPTYRIDEISVGAARIANLTTVVLPNWIAGARSPQGVLGLDFLERYFIVFDAARRELRLYDRPAANEVTGKGWRATDFRRRTFTLERGALYTVDGYANSRLARYIVDLGATGTIINKQALARISRNSIAVSVRPGSDRTSSRIIDALRNSTRQEDVVISRFKIGRTSWYDQVFTVYDAPIFEELGVAEKPYGLLGADLFHERSFALDFAGGKLHIGPRRD